MAHFKMQERDLDLFLLEEFYSNSEFCDWFSKKLGLHGYSFASAEHSVSAKANAKWGETDVLVFLKKNEETLAVLIEDKIAAEFMERQADRYHERARAILDDGRAGNYKTVLVAPSVYIATVPQDDKWDKKLTIEDLRDWFATSSTPHACWRKEALSECLSRVDRVVKIGRQETLQFSQEFASFLRTQPGDFSHKPTDDNWGLIITFPKRPTNMQFTWKIGKSCVDLTFWGPYVGKAQHIPIPVNIRPEFAHSKQKSDMFKIDVPFVDVSTPLEGQHEVLAAVMTALYELIAFAGLVSLSD